MDLGLANQLVLITGSSRGIGRGIAQAFLQEGAQVVLTGRDQAALQATAGSCRDRFGGERVRSFTGDLLQTSTVAEISDWLTKEFGRLDHLVANLGSGRSVPPLEEDQEEWQRLLNINLLSATNCVHYLRPLLEKSAAQTGIATSITFISSICGVEALGCPLAYAAAKSALISYAKNLARVLGPRAIRVNVVSPGNILFPGSTWEDKLNAAPQEVESMLQREVPLGRLGTMGEVADVVVFLASFRAAFVTGANWVVDGGQTRSH